MAEPLIPDYLPQKIQHLLEGIPPLPHTDILLVYDGEGVIHYLNRKLKGSFQNTLSPEAMKGRSVRDFILPQIGNADGEDRPPPFFTQHPEFFPVRIQFSDATLNPKDSILQYMFFQGVPALMNVRLFEGYHLAILHVQDYYMERAKGRLTEDMMAVLKQSGEVVMFCPSFGTRLLAELHRGPLFMHHLTDSTEWSKLMNGERQSVEAQHEAIKSAAAWIPDRHLSPLQSSDWIADEGTEWIFLPDGMESIRRGRNSSITFLHSVEQIKNDLRIEFEADLTDGFAFGLLSQVDIYRAFSHLSSPDFKGYSLTLQNWPEKRGILRILLKRCGLQIAHTLHPAEDLLGAAPFAGKAVRVSIEKCAGAFRVVLNGRECALLTDPHPLLFPHQNFIGLVMNEGVRIRDIRILKRPTAFDSRRLSPEVVDLQFYKYPGHTFETRIGNLVATQGAGLQFVYMKDVTYSRNLLDKLNEYVKTLDEELSTARRVQSALGNVAIPASDKIRFAAFRRSTREVGGDLYDIKDLGGNRFAVLIYDVSGHGIGAALVAAMAKMAFESAFRETASPADILGRVNRDLCAVTEASMFLTALLCVLDTEAMTVTYARAGHCPAVLFNAARPAAPISLEQGGPILGNSAAFDFQEFIEPLLKGDRMLFYTDGIIEIRNESDKFFGKQRIFDEIRNSLDKSLDTTRDLIVASAEKFRQGKPFEDDATFLLAEIL